MFCVQCFLLPICKHKGFHVIFVYRVHVPFLNIFLSLCKFSSSSPWALFYSQLSTSFFESFCALLSFIYYLLFSSLYLHANALDSSSISTDFVVVVVVVVFYLQMHLASSFSWSYLQVAPNAQYLMSHFLAGVTGGGANCVPSTTAWWEEKDQIMVRPLTLCLSVCLSVCQSVSLSLHKLFCLTLWHWRIPSMWGHANCKIMKKRVS